MTAKLSPVIKVQQNSIIPVNIEVKKRLDKWDRVETLLEQDEDKIVKEFCRRLPNEDDTKYHDRKKTFIDTFINITQDLVTAPVNSVFSQGLKLDYGSNTSIIKTFNENVTKTNAPKSMQEYMSEVVGLQLRAFGSICTIIDKPSFLPMNLDDELKNGMPYITSIRLQDIINWQLDENGDFEWFIYKKTWSQPWVNPFANEKPVTLELECMFTKTEYVVRERNGNIIPELSYVHNFGFVPVSLRGSFTLRESDILGNAAMFQSSNSIINMNNCLNVGNYELYKHGGSLLLMHEDAMVGANLEANPEGDVELKKHDKGGVLPWGGENEPSYLVKDIKSDQFMEWARFYQEAAVENERDLKSVAKKGSSGEMVQESGFAKVVDREPLEANLIALSEDIEGWYKDVIDKVSMILGRENDSTIEFDKDYDLRSIKQKYEELGQAIKNKCEQVSPTLFKEHWKNVAPDITRDEDTLVIINQEIDEYDPDILQDEIDAEVEKQFNNEKNIAKDEEK